MALLDQTAPERQISNTITVQKGNRRGLEWPFVVLWAAAGVTLVWIGVVSWAALYALSRLFA
jgi:hypothetical protein